MKNCNFCHRWVIDAEASCKICGCVDFTDAVTMVGPLATQEVENLFIEARDNEVRGSWTFDVPVGRVRVFRAEGHPPGELGDGQEIELTGPHSFVDRDVTNGRDYYYRVMVQYDGPNNLFVPTRGVTAKARPNNIPPAVNAIKISMEHGIVHVTWKPPARGAVSIYRMTDKPTWRSGERIPIAKLSGLGTPLRNSLDGLAVDFKPTEKVAFYVPMNISSDVAVVGEAQRFVITPEVSKLIAQNLGRYLLLQWQWPEDCTNAMVLWRHDTYPQDIEESGTKSHQLTRGEYEKDGGFLLKDPPNMPHWFVVLAATEMDGEFIYSAGTSPGASYELPISAPVNIAYKISVNRWRRNHATLNLSAESEISRLPDVVVVARKGDIRPLPGGDETVLATFSDLRIPAGTAVSVSFELDSVPRPFYLRVFFRNPSLSQRIALIDPPPQELKFR